MSFLSKTKIDKRRAIFGNVGLLIYNVGLISVNNKLNQDKIKFNTGHSCCITFIAISLSCQDFLGRSRGVIRTLTKIYDGAFVEKS